MKEVSLIYDFEKELSKYGLTCESYEALLKDCSDKVQKITDVEWAELISKYNLGVHYDTLRKSSQFITGGAFVSEYYKWKTFKNKNIDEDEYFKKIRLEKQEIQKEKRKLFDERLDINKRLREESRLETTIEKIEDMLTNIGTERYISYSPIAAKSDNDMIVCLSDLHIGASFYNFDGCYDSDIAKDRLNKYLAEIISIQETHKAENCVVMLLCH